MSFNTSIAENIQSQVEKLVEPDADYHRDRQARVARQTP